MMLYTLTQRVYLHGSVQRGTHRRLKVFTLTEKNEIEKMGGRPQRNSGRGILEKGDATLGPFLVDVKEYSESFSVSRKNWAKLQSDAFRAQQRQPMFWLALGSEEQGATPLRLVVIHSQMFEQMYDAWKQVYGEQG